MTTTAKQIAHTDFGTSRMGMLRAVLVVQIGAGLLWAISMLLFTQQIVLGEASGPHLEKILLEGTTHLMLVFGAVLVWLAPAQSRGVLLLMIFLNAMWAVVDMYALPAYKLPLADFGAKIVINGGFAIGLTFGGRRAGILGTGPADTSRNLTSSTPRP